MDNIEENLRILAFEIKNIIPTLSNVKISYVNYVTTEFEYDGFVSWEENHIEMVDESSIYFQMKKIIKISNELKNAKRSVEEFILDFVDKSEIVKMAVENNLNNSSILSDSFLDEYIKRVITIILKFSDDNLELIDLTRVKEEIKVLVETSMKELRGEPLNCELSIKLRGISLISEEIKINDNIKLRMPKKEDCDIIIDNPFLDKPSLIPPSAILEIKDTVGFNLLFDISGNTKYFLAILRLFKPGFVFCMGFNFKSEAILNNKFISARVKTENYSQFDESSKNYILEKIFIDPFKNFIDSGIEFDKLFSNDFLHLKIAYEQYCNALREDKNSNFEKLITETIIGFEALFMKKGDKAGGAYKVRITISKLFDSLLMSMSKAKEKEYDNYNPENVSKRIRDGFRVRNKYSHGEHISRKMLDEFAEEYGGIDKLLSYLIDYLRISIILMIIEDKTKILDLINDSLIKLESNEKLIQKFPDIKSFMLLNNIELYTND
jgi:hypothetical protein